MTAICKALCWALKIVTMTKSDFVPDLLCLGCIELFSLCLPHLKTFLISYYLHVTLGHFFSIFVDELIARQTIPISGDLDSRIVFTSDCVCVFMMIMILHKAVF